VWGIDVGGANLKVAATSGACAARPFALWRDPGGLAGALRELLDELPPAEKAAVTMTGELADCFATKQEGVHAILDAVAAALAGREFRVYLTDGRLAKPAEARSQPLLAAASNWHATATLAARRHVPTGCGLLVEIGSTTADLIPLAGGEVASSGRTDTERLLAGELVYTGVDRTPLFALLPSCRLRGRRCGTAPEWFATAADAYLLLGEMAPEPENCQTADGRPRTLENAHGRVARLVCGDRTLITLDEVRDIAREFREAQLELLAGSVAAALTRWPGVPATIVAGGQGEFLARSVAERLGLADRVIALSEVWGKAASRGAPAYALAALAAESVW
jgi:probable H4MPT-linked C1 transfer pathway protein